MESLCTCGRPQSDASFLVQRGTLTRWVYYTCSCGREWTVPEVAEDLAEPVTADEIIRVHEALMGDLTVEELTK
jgi:hypothetical protein